MQGFINLMAFLIATTSAFAQEFDTTTTFGAAQQASYEKKFFKALEYSKQAIREDSSYSSAYYMLAQIYSEFDSIESEKAILELAQRKFPWNEEIIFRLGKVKMNLKQYHSAINDFLTVLKIIDSKGYISATTITAHFEIGNAYLNLKDYIKATIYYTIVLEAQPLNSAALINRGMAYLNSKQKTKACKDWKKGYKLGIHEIFKYIKKYCN